MVHDDPYGYGMNLKLDRLCTEGKLLPISGDINSHVK